MTATKLRKKHRQIPIGNMSDVIKIQTRSIDSPAFGATDFGEDFSDVPDTWASVETIKGQTRFDGVSRDVNVTHRIGIRYDSSVTSESWILLSDGQRLDVVDVDNVEELSEFIVLICTTRGLSDRESSKV